MNTFVHRGAEQVTQAWSAVWTRAAMSGSVMGGLKFA
jgi:hypothetical protein